MDVVVVYPLWQNLITPASVRTGVVASRAATLIPPMAKFNYSGLSPHRGGDF